MTSDAVVRLDGVTVRYRFAVDAGLSLKEWIVRRHQRRTKEHEALHDINLEVMHGETVGIIGRNGAGKTTLLRVISRLLQPAEGRLRIRGTVAPMIDLLGAVHYDLTGRENAYFAGALLGLSRRTMRERIDAIADFADIGEFFDAPLRTYSAGMLARLTFATATSIDAGILLIDEALAVGDAAFYQKSSARIDEGRRRGVTTIVVSHDLSRLAELCDRIVWLEGGRMASIGRGREVVQRYLEFATHGAG